jgi:hypothetical protein
VVLRRRSPPLADAVALGVFVTIGVLTHDASFAAWLRDLALFEASWFLCRRHWLPAVTLAVGVRALVVGHFSVAFYLVALAFTALLVACFRSAWRRFSW